VAYCLVLPSFAGETRLDGSHAGTRVPPVVEGQQEREREQEPAAGELGVHTGAYGGPLDYQGAKTGGQDRGKRGAKPIGGLGYEDEDTLLSFSDESAGPHADADSGGGGGTTDNGDSGGPVGGCVPSAGRGRGGAGKAVGARQQDVAVRGRGGAGRRGGRGRKGCKEQLEESDADDVQPVAHVPPPKRRRLKKLK
jgi:hypothetical protein